MSSLCFKNLIEVKIPTHIPLLLRSQDPDSHSAAALDRVTPDPSPSLLHRFYPTSLQSVIAAAVHHHPLPDPPE
ncbi:hypothetical protein ACFX2I_037562 [Malus domestica]